jgi:glycosyltransferase involved in cell wall biosynthesis
VMIGHRTDRERAQLEGWVAKTGQAERFTLLRERSDALVCMAAMDVFCLSSRNEGFPLVVGEAMAAGVPCVVTDVGDTALLVGDTGVVVPKEDAVALAAGLERVLRMAPEERRQLGLNASERVQDRFTIRHALERFELLYGSMINGGT